MPSSTRVDPACVTPDDPRYQDLVRRGFNKRFIPRPDHVRLVTDTGQAVAAVQEAVREGRRVVARSGGHCLEGFVGEPTINVVVDLGLMTGVSYDVDRNAFEVAAGSTLGEVYRRLQLGWGVLLPAGQSPDVGMGGHIPGGAFGFLCRRDGLAVDHLDAVEVVVVDDGRTARAVVATRDPADPNADLFWAHTGGGAGNFGIVTRCWFRTPGATSTDPASALPRSPDRVLVFRAAWRWSDLTESQLVRLGRNFGAWAEAHDDPDGAEARLFGTLFLHRRQLGQVFLKGLVAGGAGAERLADAYLAAVLDGVPAPATRETQSSSWLAFATDPFPELYRMPPGLDLRNKVKDACLRRGLTEDQLGTVVRHLTRDDIDLPGGLVGMSNFGGRTNSVAPGATAAGPRRTVLDLACSAGWVDPAEDGKYIDWARTSYRDIFAGTGGAPVPGPAYDGAQINHPDVDLADPAWNRSGVPWHRLYYQDNYARLQQVKKRWDPANVFHHALSVRLPGA
jgi:FAD/FMN-containing dehydrogenase